MQSLPETRPAWKSDLTGAMRALGYTPMYRREALAYARGHGTLDGCEHVEAEDLAALGALVPAPERAPSWDAEPYEPTPEDEAWWSAESDRLDADYDYHAAEAGATELLCRGLIPRDLAGELARTSLVGHDA